MDLFFLLKSCDQLLPVQVQADLPAAQRENRILPNRAPNLPSHSHRAEERMVLKHEEADTASAQALPHSGISHFASSLPSPSKALGLGGHSSFYWSVSDPPFPDVQQRVL